MFTPALKLLVTAVKKVSTKAIRDFNELEHMQGNVSEANNFANVTQKLIQDTIYEDLHKFKSNYSFIVGDKLIQNKDESNTIIINGIVGFNNFVRTIPYFAINVVLARDFKPFASVYYNPITNEMFSAEQGFGAFYNKLKLRYHATENKPSTISYTDYLGFASLPHSDSHSVYISGCKALDLCYLSANKIDSCYFKDNISYAETMGALLIAQESNLILLYEEENKQWIKNLSIKKI